MRRVKAICMAICAAICRRGGLYLPRLRDEEAFYGEFSRRANAAGISALKQIKKRNSEREVPFYFYIKPDIRELKTNFKQA